MRKSFLLIVLVLSLISLQISAQTWSAPQRLTWNGGESDYPAIAVDPGNRIHVVWQDDSPGNCEIFYKHSTNAGVTWSSPVRLTWNSYSSNYPFIAADTGSGIHVVWGNDTDGYPNIFYKRSANSGATWSSPTRLTWGDDCETPIITIDQGGILHVVWQGYYLGNWQILYKRSTNGGTSWSALKPLTWNASGSYYPYIASGSGNQVHVAWCRDDSFMSLYEIYYKRSTDSGQTWAGVNRMTWNTKGSYYPVIDTDTGNGVYMVWHDYMPGQPEIYLKRSTDLGSTWQGLQRLTWNGVASECPAIAADSGSGIHLVWAEVRLSNYDIYYKSSTNSGAAWSSPTRLTWNTGRSFVPRIAVDSGGGAHVVWRDETPGNPEIYYKNRK